MDENGGNGEGPGDGQIVPVLDRTNAHRAEKEELVHLLRQSYKDSFSPYMYVSLPVLQPDGEVLHCPYQILNTEWKGFCYTNV